MPVAAPIPALVAAPVAAPAAPAAPVPPTARAPVEPPREGIDNLVQALFVTRTMVARVVADENARGHDV